MKAIDILVEYGKIRFVRVRQYQYIRLCATMPLDFVGLAYSLRDAYGGHVNCAANTCRWEATHVDDIREAALHLLRDIHVGRAIRGTMSMIIRYCGKMHGSRSNYAKGLRSLFDTNNIRLSDIVNHRRQ